MGTMGRAKSNTKRRPKGKRGWRKIETDAFLKPQQTVSLQEEKIRIEKLKNSQLWKEDLSPQRRRKKLTRSQKKLRAKRKLLARGFEISSIESNNKLNANIASYKKQKRLSAFKWSTSKKSKPAPPPKSATIKFSNKTSKKIQVDNAKKTALNKKTQIKNTDYHKNDPYLLYKVKHSKKNSQNMQPKDLWSQSPKKHTDSSLKIEKMNKSEEDMPDLPDVRALDVMSAQKKAVGGHMSGGRAIQNKFAPIQSLISLPNPGESINPLQHQYYYLKWKALELQHKQLFQKKYQFKATEKWYKKTGLSNGINEDVGLNKLKANRDKMKKMYQFHLGIYRRIQSKVKGDKKNEGKQVFARQISAKDRKLDYVLNRKAKKQRIFAKKRKRRLIRKSDNNGHVFGSKYRFKHRANPTMSADKISNNLRRTLHSGIDNPLSFMFNEMQKQNKIHGARRNRFVFPRKKGFLGPRYKVQTRIGKLHHMNVGNRYFSGIDD